jgi:hypothetical protein
MALKKFLKFFDVFYSTQPPPQYFHLKIRCITTNKKSVCLTGDIPTFSLQVSA